MRSKSQNSKSLVKDLKKIALIGWVILTTFYGVWMVGSLKTQGLKDTLQEIRKQSANLTLDNKILENKIAEQSSLRVVEQKAETLGFEEVKIKYLK